MSPHAPTRSTALTPAHGPGERHPTSRLLPSGRSWWPVALVWTGLGIASPAFAELPPLPPPLEFTPAESSRLNDRNAVVRMSVSEGEAETTAIIDVAATPDVVMVAVMDLPASNK